MNRYSLLMLLCFVIGCGNNHLSIVGNWKPKSEKAPITIEFSAEEMYVKAGANVIKLGKYKFIDKETIEVELTDDGRKIIRTGQETREAFKKADAEISGKDYTPEPAFVSNVTRYKIKVDVDTLTMQRDGEKEDNYTRVK